MFDHIAMALRSTLLRAVVRAIDDGKAEQLLTVDSHYGHMRSQVPVYQIFGHASRVPLDGAITALFQVGGDPSDLMALPPCNPSAARFGNLGEGDSVVYDACGQRMHFHNGRLVEIEATSELRVAIGGNTVLDITAKKAVLSVPLDAQQGITTTTVKASQDVTAAGVSLVNHPHGGVVHGNDQSGKPIGS
ncbi:phage baseplate assembly protein domain-containing protein [Gluconacetobacter azotocaptans]|uniref:phage baseplate assembly protein domain-containing protein n=1 Tax=Gluconacetobacter azotocaptans TaxID=142834 RepID=UPI001F04A149|nr:phage baseplate assembly protein [Gluconacetobacter azotocaptans]